MSPKGNDPIDLINSHQALPLRFHITHHWASRVQAFGFHDPTHTFQSRPRLHRQALGLNTEKLLEQEVQYLWRPQVTHRGPAQIWELLFLLAKNSTQMLFANF